MQGRIDIPLPPESRADVAQCRIPDAFAKFRVLCSPLRRCVETAAALRLVVSTDARLVEMDWGTYQGRTLAELRAEHGDHFAQEEAHGLDFRPPGGESPRDVQARLASLLAEIARQGRPTLAITHRGVVRAIHAHARGWDMIGKPPDDLGPHALHLFDIDADGQPHVDCLNIPLERR
jgi:probable phosphoglycerate mutase